LANKRGVAAGQVGMSKCIVAVRLLCLVALSLSSLFLSIARPQCLSFRVAQWVPYGAGYSIHFHVQSGVLDSLPQPLLFQNCEISMPSALSRNRRSLFLIYTHQVDFLSFIATSHRNYLSGSSSEEEKLLAIFQSFHSKQTRLPYSSSCNYVFPTISSLKQSTATGYATAFR
jgi:hypothetical protein